MDSNKITARIAGLLYLIMGITGFFNMVYIPSKLIVYGDATTTINNIAASELLFRLGIIINLFSQICFILLVLVLYRLLKAVHKTYALLMVVLVVTAVSIICFNMLNQYAILLPLSGAEYFKVFNQDQLHALAMLFLDLYSNGIHIAELFWGLWLLPLGLLVIKSGFIPRILGVLLIIGCFGYLISSFTHILFLDNIAIIPVIMSTLSAIAELSFMSWLLIKGVKAQQSNHNHI